MKQIQIKTEHPPFINVKYFEYLKHTSLFSVVGTDKQKF
jgi:hypothetical protein